MDHRVELLGWIRFESFDTLGLADERDDRLDFFGGDALDGRHVPEPPVMARHTPLSCEEEGDVRVMARLVHGG